MLCICTKFFGNTLKGFRVIEETRFVTDRRTNRQIDNYGKNNMSPPDAGGGGHNHNRSITKITGSKAGSSKGGNIGSIPQTKQ